MSIFFYLVARAKSGISRLLPAYPSLPLQLQPAFFEIIQKFIDMGVPLAPLAGDMLGPAA
jgi:hypothetical protein